MKTYAEITLNKEFPNTTPVDESTLKDAAPCTIEIHGISNVRGKGTVIKWKIADAKITNVTLVTDKPLQAQLKGIDTADLPVIASLKKTGKGNLNLS